MATLYFLMPPVTAVIDFLVRGDTLTPYKLAGLAFAALGVYLATRSSGADWGRVAHPGAVTARRPFDVPVAAARRSCPVPCGKIRLN